MIKYYQAEDIEKEAIEIVKTLNWNHIHLDSVAFLRSKGSKSKRTIARCHAMGKAMQLALKRNKGFYLIEVISERFDKLSKTDQTKVIIHELMHIPNTFGGGFKHHDIVTDKNVDKVYKHYINLKLKKKWF